MITKGNMILVWILDSSNFAVKDVMRQPMNSEQDCNLIIIVLIILVCHC